ncbi:MAG: hypothetical protein M3471_08825, partial [Actinomycetota bacterium]|nr:hypothetical protein [Actinomycetota bacterium]
MTSTQLRHANPLSTSVRRPPALLPTLAVLLAGLVLGAATTSPSFVRGAVALSAFLAVVMVVLRAPRQAAVGLLVWLVVLGSLRRMLLGTGSPGDNDPLLLVAPAVLIVLVVVAARRGAFRSRTPLANAILVLSGLLLVGTLNPLQGGIAAGFAGLLFVLVPILWFWVGR